ncbi:MAG: LysR family transcriptional regulator [Clostridia bacterium]|nr:LysR family transcriptional regulator [Clostridia bacterium]NCC43141.1 LysR family transcriptional regulator [Clostridia bacterium]
MTSSEIEAFLSIIRCGNISISAKELYVTQSALSRRLKALESELGYQLLIRQKGMHNIQLTEEGKAFLPVAEKWMSLWEETSAIRNLDQKPLLKMASIGSVSTYILPEIFRDFLKDNKYNLEFHLYHSQEAYGYVESGLVDFAFVSNPMYSKTVQTIPFFSEPFVIASNQKLGREHAVINTESLAPQNEVRLPWNQEYDSWHRQWFDESIYPNVFLDQMSLMEEFLANENWAIVPWSVGEKLEKKGVHIYNLSNAPTDRVIYYLVKNDEKKELVDCVLQLLRTHIEEKKHMKILV